MALDVVIIPSGDRQLAVECLISHSRCGLQDDLVGVNFVVAKAKSNIGCALIVITVADVWIERP